jgi:hypothetical protein
MLAIIQFRIFIFLCCFYEYETWCLTLNEEHEGVWEKDDEQKNLA